MLNKKVYVRKFNAIPNKAENYRLRCGYGNRITSFKQEVDMANKRNTRNPKNGYPMARAGGASGAGSNPAERKLSPIERKLIAKREYIRKKLYAKYGNLIYQLSYAELAEIIRLNFGDDPYGAVLEETDPIGNALQQMYGKPTSQRIY